MAEEEEKTGRDVAGTDDDEEEADGESGDEGTGVFYKPADLIY